MLLYNRLQQSPPEVFVPKVENLCEQRVDGVKVSQDLESGSVVRGSPQFRQHGELSSQRSSDIHSFQVSVVRVSQDKVYRRLLHTHHEVFLRTRDSLVVVVEEIKTMVTMKSDFITNFMVCWYANFSLPASPQSTFATPRFVFSVSQG